MTMGVLATTMLQPLLLLAQDEEPRGMTLLEQINNGGLTGYIIILLSLVAATLAVMNIIAIQPKRLVPPHLVAALQGLLINRDVVGALEVCKRVENDSFLTRVLAQGLNRYQRSAFGPFEFKDAIEEAGAEEVARLYRKTDALGLIGSIAPMLGLLGTVIGMVGAFSTISSSGARPELLAADISKALITTLMGLCVAIPTMAVFSYLRNRIDHYAALAAQTIEEITVGLEPTGAPPAGAARAAAAAPARPMSAPAPSGPTRPAAPPAASARVGT
ncbi:MAG: MotA/TolQ/ExbB proton channel family protein [Phycisphaerales bacterium]|nr:MotA/TolQ/ExbB proton channel family protein [Phycisphaerales bacterium]